MDPSKRLAVLNKDSTFVIRRSIRPPSTAIMPRIRDSPDKKVREGRNSINDSYSINRFLGPSSLGLSTTCWCIYDSINNKQYGFRHHYQRQIASLTKIMTTLVAIEAIQRWQLKLNMLVKITETSSKLIGTTANLKANTWICLRDLLYGCMLPSGNDAAYTLAETIGYFILAAEKYRNTDHFASIQEMNLTGENTSVYVSEFIKSMNLKADELELIQTHFSNPHGLQNAMNVSSAKDVLLLCLQATKNCTFRHVMNTQAKRYEYYYDQYKSDKVIEYWQNTNILLRRGWQGVKTGQTLTAGCCLASLREGVYIVVLNSVDVERRFSDTEKLYQWVTQRRTKLQSLQMLRNGGFNP